MLREMDHPYNVRHFEFCVGTKLTELDINLTHYSASIRFGTRYGLGIRRIPNETTSSFLMADAILRNTANNIKHSITLTFDTANSHLKLWAIDKCGKLGFTVDPADPEAYRETITKTYTPEEEDA